MWFATPGLAFGSKGVKAALGYLFIEQSSWFVCAKLSEKLNGVLSFMSICSDLFLGWLYGNEHSSWVHPDFLEGCLHAFLSIIHLYNTFKCISPSLSKLQNVFFLICCCCILVAECFHLFFCLVAFMSSLFSKEYKLAYMVLLLHI